ncbi:tubulin glycylase 3C (macronuclear) [Tetrahymena thermophila SB210]|uniref:Tubulin glycylase 3F n=1 Tax=Tetrahymena thermophila (strain SB210) TaxID=312017 RepID=TTL3F_TETTS|nr:tubulin glycylase 3C [Tetrahymena thermophila SB210]P0CAZ1.2 RecName: Full=Tubulin glycylase 3F [Tetrahymena thermophila SB210]EAS01070.2 tubulin glycylase 3C [Tetrahymena thermophila SB210]|eukprot:XP_001021315.2 tubulin glycylase 3C [Tetrahymena thermophila SB210]
MSDRIYHSYVNNFYQKAKSPKNTQLIKQIQRSNPTSPKKNLQIYKNINPFNHENCQRIIEENAIRFSDKKTVQLGTVYGCNILLTTKNSQPKVFEKLIQLSDNSNFRQVTLLKSISPVSVVKAKDFLNDSISNRSRSAQKMYSDKDKFQVGNNKSSLRSLIYFPLANIKDQISEESKSKRNKIKVIKDMPIQLDNSFQTINHQINSPNNNIVGDQSHVILHNIFKKRQQAEEGLQIQEEPQNYIKNKLELQERKMYLENQNPKSLSPIKIHFNEKSMPFKNKIQKKITYNEQSSIQQTITLIKKKILGPPSLYSRLKKNSEQFKNIENLIKNKAKESHEQNMQEYLKRIGCTDKNKKVFCINSQDQFVQEVLIELGWIENKLFKSDLFHLKWIYTDINKDYENLKEGQFYNHFQNNQELTNKGRLLRNIKLYLVSYPHLQKYFPIQFDVIYKQQKEEFLNEFQKFEIFRKFKDVIQIIKNDLTQELINQLTQIYHTKFIKKEEEEELQYGLITYFRQNQQFKQYIEYINQVNKDIINLLSKIPNPNINEMLIKYLNDLSILQVDKLECDQEQGDKNIQAQIINLSISIELDNILEQIYPYTNFCNFWIIKPCGSSKGQGLQIMSDDNQIVNYTTQLQARLVQKYIERIYICKSQEYPQLYNKKFDLRLWVLVKSFNPLTVYYYKHAYLRVCSSEYDLSDTRNIFSHFTNYSINRNKFIQNKNVEDSAISLKLLKHIIKKEHGISYQKKIQPQINEIIIHSLKSVQKKIKQNNSCFEIYGFDIIFDEQFNPYLLEVNLSPACSKRNEFISKLQKEMFISTLNILFNTEYYQIQNWKKIKIQDQIQKVINESTHTQLQEEVILNSNNFQSEDSEERFISAAITIQKWYRQIKLMKNENQKI